MGVWSWHARCVSDFGGFLNVRLCPRFFCVPVVSSFRSASRKIIATVSPLSSKSVTTEQAGIEEMLRYAQTSLCIGFLVLLKFLVWATNHTAYILSFQRQCINTGPHQASRSLRRPVLRKC
jgi:hypothetical protein